MDLRKKAKKGFTLIELMVVIVIIGILVAIALPNFISAQDRAKLSSVKANMHTVQTTVETYAVDWGGVYAAALEASATVGIVPEARDKSYWKDFKNPFTGTSGEGKAYIGAAFTNNDTEAKTKDGCTSMTQGGAVAYAGLDTAGTITKYYVYGGDKANKNCLVDKGIAFTLTNQ